jgi:hypothetical protein
MKGRIPISAYRRLGWVLMTVELLALLAVGRAMSLADMEPPPPPMVVEEACHDCAAQRTAMEMWNAAGPSQRWQCRSPSRDWEGIRTCLSEAGERHGRREAWRLD